MTTNDGLIIQGADGEHQRYRKLTELSHVQSFDAKHWQHQDNYILEHCASAVGESDGVYVKAFSFNIPVPKGMNRFTTEDCN